MKTVQVAHAGTCLSRPLDADRYLLNRLAILMHWISVAYEKGDSETFIRLCTIGVQSVNATKRNNDDF